jgi:hypothetical protein
MYEILALAKNVGGLPKYRRKMAANVCGKCMRQMYSANVGGKGMRQMYAANVGGKHRQQNIGGKCWRQSCAEL